MSDKVHEAPVDEAEGSPRAVWLTVALFVGFVVLMSSCIAVNFF
ncbi:hypothetical protein [Microbacterium sp.]